MSNRWLTIVLILSIGLNLVLVGVFIGRMVFGPGERPPFAWALTEISDETRGKVRGHLRDLRVETRPLRAEHRNAQASLREALNQEPLDEQQVRQAFSRLRTTTGSMQAAMHDQMILILKELTPEERKTVYRMLSRPPMQRPHPGSPRP